MRLPEMRLFPKANDAGAGDRPGRQYGLAVICRRVPGALGQLLKLPAKHIIHAQSLRNFTGNIKMMGSLCVDICLLKQYQIRISALKEFDDASQFQPAIDVPVDQAESHTWPRYPAARCKVADLDLWTRIHVAPQSDLQNIKQARASSRWNKRNQRIPQLSRGPIFEIPVHDDH